MPRINTLVSSFNRPQYSIPDSKRLRLGWHNMREFIKIDHPDPQAKIIIDNKLMDEVGWLRKCPLFCCLFVCCCFVAT